MIVGEEKDFMGNDGKRRKKKKKRKRDSADGFSQRRAHAHAFCMRAQNQFLNFSNETFTMHENDSIAATAARSIKGSACIIRLRIVEHVI